MFDFSFRKFVSVDYARIIWFFCLLKFFCFIAAGLACLVYAFSSRDLRVGLAFGCVFVASPLILLSERMAIEAFVVAFRIYEQLASINRKTQKPR